MMSALKFWPFVALWLMCLHLGEGSDELLTTPKTLVIEGKEVSFSPFMHTPFSLADYIKHTSGPASLGRRVESFGDGTISDGLDLRLTPRQYARLYFGLKGRDDHHSLASTPWTDSTVPYVVENEDFSQEQRDRILGAMRNWEHLTCVKFRPATPHDANSINIHHGSGCWANLGMKGGVQTVNLDTNGCFWKGTVEHELGHAIGLIHEHQRPDRDAYIRVNYYTVGRSSVAQLTKYARGSDDKMGLDYDYDSVMHYGKTAFARDYASQTVYTRDPTKEDVIGMTLFPSFIDAKLVNLMYKCNDHCQSPPTCAADCFVDKNCQCFCKSDMPIETCVDKHQNCSQWAQGAECDRNPGFMHDKCRKSCKICNDDGSTPRLPCVDGHDRCGEWAKGGQCQTNAGFMLRSCKLACGLCEVTPHYDTADTCSDKNSTCRKRAENGDCIRKAGVMLKDCKQSCDFCPGKFDDPYEREGPCVDPDSVCTYWADNGLCYKFYTTMSLKCRSACNTCNKTISIPDGCVDTHPSCGAWALSGECDVNPGFMLKGCQLSCNVCPGMVKPDVCVDYDMECPDWMDRGECVYNPTWMSKNCRKSCHYCGGGNPITPGPCSDSNAQCAQWKDMGECQRNPRWMLSHCKKSCGTCTDGSSTVTPVQTTTAAGGCSDDKVDCYHWAEAGHCKLNPGYMLHHCKKSCHVCEGTSSVVTHPPVTTPVGGGGDCKNDNPNCDAWAAAQLCDERPDYMLVHCVKACTHNCTTGGEGGSGTTSTPSVSCLDGNELCVSWRHRFPNICKDNFQVQRQCKKTCGNCDGTCINDNRNCQDWADNDQCNVNAEYMMQHCRKACKACT